MNRVWIGWDPREAAAFAVARYSMTRHASRPLEIHGLVLGSPTVDALYRRPTIVDEKGRLFDVLSKRDDYDGAISTQHAIARFLVPHLAGRHGWAMFCDGDILVRDDVNALFDGLDPAYAVYCVKHEYAPPEGIKMDGRAQTRYARKNWSSVVIFNCDHSANSALTLDLVNTAPGRDLHAFSWLNDNEIGSLGPEWNWLVGHSDPTIDPSLVHFTEGVPDMPGYGDIDFAEEWRDELAEWAERGR